MKSLKSNLFIGSISLIFLVVVTMLFAFDVEKTLADNCTSSFSDGGYACIDINNATQTKNIFDTSTACQSGYCSGAANIQCCRTTCNSDEKCTNLTVTDGKNYNPAGMTCVDRGVCGANRGCCKSSGSGNSGGAVTPGSGTTGEATDFANPLNFFTVDKFLSQIMGALQKIIVTLSLLVIVYGAVMYVISAGDSKRIDSAKNAITASLVGLALGLAAPSFLKEIAGILGWGTSDTRLAAALSLSQIAINVLNFLLGSLGILSLIMLVIGAGMYLSSAGDQGQIDTGKKIFKSALIGVFLAMASMVLVTQVARLFITG